MKQILTQIVASTGVTALQKPLTAESAERAGLKICKTRIKSPFSLRNQ